MYDVYIGLGSNKGNRERHLSVANKIISSLTGVYTLKRSSVYFTEPWGKKDQNWFLNQAVYLKCTPEWTPLTFLRALLDVELEMGRERSEKWGPRNIDIDLLLFGDCVINTEELILPHPYITQRAFVLVPLLEINPLLKLPTGELLKDELKKLDYCVKDKKIYQQE